MSKYQPLKACGAITVSCQLPGLQGTAQILLSYTAVRVDIPEQFVLDRPLGQALSNVESYIAAHPVAHFHASSHPPLPGTASSV